MNPANPNPALIRILMADDDQEDCELMQEAMSEQKYASCLDFVHDGEALLARLRAASPNQRPDLILLDLNMPRMNGIEALRCIREDPDLKLIPVVILTTSTAEQDVVRSYEAGGNSYITKPITFDALTDVATKLLEYWFSTVRIPA